SPPYEGGATGGLFSQVPTFLLAWTTTPWTLPGNPALAVDRAWVERELADTWRHSAPFRAAVKTHWERTGACPTLEELGLEALPPLTLMRRAPYYRNQEDGGSRPPPSCEFGFMWTDGSDTGRFFWWPEEVYPAGRDRARITSRGDWRFLWE
ncbi:hypothetical protein IIA16_03990, partial [bacterium]|nr:hypothetical protein [bacterium]